jgi:small subunit ribosomal protein S17
MAKKKETKAEQEAKIIVDTKIDSKVGTRGRVFEGVITKKFPKRVVIEFERMIYVRKYERYARLKTKIHARTPLEFEDKIKVGDLIRVRECRPLSKIIHFLVIEKLKDAVEVGK